MDDVYDLEADGEPRPEGLEDSGGPGNVSGDINDLFDNCAFLEDSQFEKGREAGERKAAEQAASYGRRLGIEKGFNLAQEVGFIGGVCSCWCQMEGQRPGSVPPRALKAVQRLCELVAEFPLGDPSDESIEDRLEDLRGKFKAVVSRLGLTQEFYPKGEPSMQLRGCVDAVVEEEEHDYQHNHCSDDLSHQGNSGGGAPGPSAGNEVGGEQPHQTSARKAHGLTKAIDF